VLHRDEKQSSVASRSKKVLFHRPICVAKSPPIINFFYFSFEDPTLDSQTKPQCYFAKQRSVFCCSANAQCKILLNGNVKNSITWATKVMKKLIVEYVFNSKLSLYQRNRYTNIHIYVFWANVRKFHMWDCFLPFRQIGLRPFQYNLMVIPIKLIKWSML